MKLSKLFVGLVFALICVAPSGGCSRAVRNGVSIGVTEGLSDGIAQLISDFLTSFGVDEG